jgi:hypothetical protein
MLQGNFNHRTDAFPASANFDAISDALNISDAEKQSAIEQGQSIFGFKLKNTAGKEEAWHIDLKETGTVGKGEAPSGKKADCKIGPKACLGILADAGSGALGVG